MIYLVKSCVEVFDNITKPVCGGWCCRMLNFKEFPNGRWASNPCDYLIDGLCSCYSDRPLACVASPFYDGSPELWPPEKFIVPWCHYRKQVLDYNGVEYVLLDSGEACIEQYIIDGLGNFERWTERKYFKNRTLFYEKLGEKSP